MKFRQEQRDFIFENYQEYTSKELAKLFNQKFDTNKNEKSIAEFKRRNKLYRGRQPSYLFNKNEVDFIFRYYRNISTQELVEKMNQEFGKEYNVTKVAHFKQRKNLKSGWNHSNKGKEILKKRHPIGHEIVNGNGDPMVKTGTENGRPVYQMKNRYIWELNYGKLNKNEVVTFRNKNNKDYRKEKLIKMSISEFSALRQSSLWNEIEYIDETIVNYVRLHLMISNKTKGIKKRKGEVV